MTKIVPSKVRKPKLFTPKDLARISEVLQWVEIPWGEDWGWLFVVYIRLWILFGSNLDLSTAWRVGVMETNTNQKIRAKMSTRELELTAKWNYQWTVGGWTDLIISTLKFLPIPAWLVDGITYLLQNFKEGDVLNIQGG